MDYKVLVRDAYRKGTWANNGHKYYSQMIVQVPIEVGCIFEQNVTMPTLLFEEPSPMGVLSGSW